MWLQNKFLELFKKPKVKNNSDEKNMGNAENGESAPDIFDEENVNDINKEKK